MFFKLLRFELKKIFLNKKWLILFALMIAITGVFIVNSINTVKIAQSDKYTSTEKELDTFKETYKKDPELYNANTAYYNKKCAVLIDKMKALQNYNWRDELKLDIELKNVEIEHLKSQGITDENSFKNFNDSIKDESWYLDNNIQPVDPKNSILGQFFIINFFRKIFPLIIVLLLMMTVCDTFSSEFDEGSYKVLFVQPIKRHTILFSKLLASIVYNLLFFLAGILPIYFILCNINSFFTGWGSPNHPVIINKNLISLFSLPTPLKTVVGEEFKYVFPMAIVSILLITCITFLISVICNSSSQSVITSTVTAIILYILGLILGNSKLNFLSLNSYCDVISLIEGKSGTFLNITVGLLACLILSIILIAASTFIVHIRQYDE